MCKDKQQLGKKKNMPDPTKESEDILAIFGSLPSKEIENKDWKRIRKEARDESFSKKHF